MFKVCLSAVLIYCLVGNTLSASVLDILGYDFGSEFSDSNAAQERDSSSTGKARNCLCNGPACICCVDFNLTFIDLGGPGCVRMKYLSPDEGLAVNVSYGESLLHSETVKGPAPKPTCIDIFSRIAQMCARFTELVPQDGGLRGCLSLEPTLLGETQIEFSVGCFKMGPAGMEMIPNSVANNDTETDSSHEQVEESTDIDSELPDASSEQETTIGGLNAEQIIAVVNQSAEEGIAFFTHLLGINFGKPTNATESTTEVEEDVEEPVVETASNTPLTEHQRSGKAVAHSKNNLV